MGGEILAETGNWRIVHELGTGEIYVRLPDGDKKYFDKTTDAIRFITMESRYKLRKQIGGRR